MMSKRRIISVWACFMAVILWSACGKKKATPPASVPADTTETAVPEEKDSTLYGEAGDCGMSTFCLITDKGDTLYVNRESDDGKDGAMYGELILGNRFCMTTRDKGQALGVAINLTQLNTFTKDYRIMNGHLILSPKAKPDTVQILTLSEDSLVVKGQHGVEKWAAKPAKQKA